MGQVLKMKHMAEINAGVAESFSSTANSDSAEKAPESDPINDTTPSLIALENSKLGELYQGRVFYLRAAASGASPAGDEAANSDLQHRDLREMIVCMAERAE